MEDIIKRDKRSYCFDPLIGKDPEILILGTLPSKQSLKLNQYYANPRNRIWMILSEIFDTATPRNYQEKMNLLFKHNIALWDVAHSAVRPGSLDADISEEIINPIDKFLRDYPTIKVIGCNGKTAYEKLTRNFKENLGDVRLVLLKSSSPANCQFSLEEMVENWRTLFPDAMRPEN